MTYTVAYSKRADKTLDKMNAQTRKLILSWIDKHLDACDNPRAFGRPLSGDKSDQWRYRIGDYRILAEIQDAQVTILIIKVGHRRDVYEN
jgi:mRNA interferase RelE/StbE